MNKHFFYVHPIIPPKNCTAWTVCLGGHASIPPPSSHWSYGQKPLFSTYNWGDKARALPTPLLVEMKHERCSPKCRQTGQVGLKWVAFPSVHYYPAHGAQIIIRSNREDFLHERARLLTATFSQYRNGRSNGHCIGRGMNIWIIKSFRPHKKTNSL